MSYERNAPFEDQTPGQPQPQPRRAAVRIDWKRAARMMAEGARPPAVAAALGIAEDRIWRHLTRSASFRHRLCQEVERQRLLDELDFGRASREAAIAGCRRPGAVETLQWQSEQAGLAGSAADPAGLRLAVDRLGRSGRRRPGRASQALLEETQQAKDRFVAAMRADLVAAQRSIEGDLARRQAASAADPAVGTGPVSTRPDPAGPGPGRIGRTGPDSTRMGAAEPGSTRTGQTGPGRAGIGTAGPDPAGAGPAQAIPAPAGRRPVIPREPPQIPAGSAASPPVDAGTADDGDDEPPLPRSHASYYNAFIDLPEEPEEDVSNPQAGPGT